MGYRVIVREKTSGKYVTKFVGRTKNLFLSGKIEFENLSNVLNHPSAILFSHTSSAYFHRPFLAFRALKNPANMLFQVSGTLTDSFHRHILP